LAYLGGPAFAAMDAPGLALNEGPGTAGWVLLAKPPEVAMPGVVGDDLDIALEAGVPIILGPLSMAT